MPSTPALYSREFYESGTKSAAYAAQEVIPILLDVISPRSVVDVGCGSGTWARVIRDAGVVDVVGVDGNWVDRDTLVIPPETFVRSDLSRSFSLPRRFDLCLSLETAEHLPEDRAAGFVQDLTRLSDVIVFSAAVPFQGGTHHLNEKWQHYWVREFEQLGYIGVDYLRRRIWGLNEYNTWFYSQNIIIYVNSDSLGRYPKLEAEYRYQAVPPVSMVHPGLLLLHLPWEKHLSVRSYFKLFPRMAKRAIGASLRLLTARPPAPPFTAAPPGAADWIRSKE